MGLTYHSPVTTTSSRPDLMNTKKKINLIQTKKIFIVDSESTSTPRARKILLPKKREGSHELAASPPSSISAFSETLPTGFLTPSASPVSTPIASSLNQKKFNLSLNGDQFSQRTDHSFALYKILFNQPNTGGDQEANIGPMDIVWFTNFISSSKDSKIPSCSSSQRTSPVTFFNNLPLVGDQTTSDELLSSVSTPSFVSATISFQFKQELDRDQPLSSPSTSTSYPLSLLKAIYKASPSNRHSFAQVLLSTSAERVATCKGALQLSRNEELNITQTTRAVSHALGDPEFYLPRERSLPQLSDPASIPLQPQEHPHDSFLIELLYFMISVTTINNNSEEDLILSDQSLHDLFLKTLLNILKCYGVRYAKASSEFYDSVVLKLSLKSFELIASRVRGDDIKKLLLTILHAWPSRVCVAQQVAFIKALSIILPRCKSLPIAGPQLRASSSSASPTAVAPTSLTFPSCSSTPLYKILSRLNQCVTSLHVKVCSEILYLLQNDDITSLYHNSISIATMSSPLAEDLMTKLSQTADSHWNESLKACSFRCLEKMRAQQLRQQEDWL